MSAGPKIPKRGGVRNVNLETRHSNYPTLEEVFLPTCPTYPIYPTYCHGCASCAISAFRWWSSSSYGWAPKTTTQCHHLGTSCTYIESQRTGMNGKLATVSWCAHSPAFHLGKVYSLLLPACEMKICGPFATRVSAQGNPCTPLTRWWPSGTGIPGGELGDVAGEKHIPRNPHQDSLLQYHHEDPNETHLAYSLDNSHQATPALASTHDR